VTKGLKKDEVTFTFGKYKATATRDFKSFAEGYKIWRSTCRGLRGNAIGVSKAKKSLLGLVVGMGKVGRVAGNGGPKNNLGWANINTELTKIFSLKGGREIKDTQLELLEDLDNMLEEYKESDSPANPANIVFEEPLNWDDESGKVSERRKVYGHYLTEEYVEYRNEHKNANLSTDVDTNWYSYAQDGSARPPMWQALFSEDTIEGKPSKGLQYVVKDAIKSFANLGLSFRKDTPIPIQGRGSGAAALKIPEIKSMFTAFARDDEFTTPAGNFSTDKAERIIRNTPINLTTKQHQNVLRSIESDLKIPNEIEEVYIKMSRRQMKNMAILAGWKPPVKEEPKEEKPKEEKPKDTVKTSANVEPTDWRTIMKVKV